MRKYLGLGPNASFGKSAICICPELLAHVGDELQREATVTKGKVKAIELREQLALPLSFLFRKSLDSGQVPKEWKDSTISPIFKKGSRSEPANYRPVNLTSNVCKLKFVIDWIAIMQGSL